MTLSDADGWESYEHPDRLLFFRGDEAVAEVRLGMVSVPERARLLSDLEALMPASGSAPDRGNGLNQRFRIDDPALTGGNMGLIDRIFGRRKRVDQAVLVHLDGAGLPDEVYAECDLATIEDQLCAALEREPVGELDGNEMTPTGATLFLYGPDAERLFAVVEPVLRAYPLCRNARVIVRRGGPGAEQRELGL